VSCRSPTSSLITPLGFFSRGAPPPPVFRPGHGDVTYPLHHGQGLEPTLVTSLGPGRQGSRPSLHHGLGLGPTLVTSLGPRAGTGLPSPPAAARLLAHPAPATGPAWLQRIPPGPRVHTVRLPRGTGHGKGPCPAQARIGFPSPPAAARLLAHPAPATGPAWLQRIPPGPRSSHRPAPSRDRPR
jgi:hypothetical protein